MSTTQIVSKKLHVDTALDFVNEIASNGAYYVFAAKHTQYAGGDTSVPAPNDAVVNNYINIYNDMLFGKKVTDTDVRPMIVRNNWTSNTTYAMYDDTDANLHSKAFYACVNTGAQYHVYKCLYNDGNTASTEEPTGTDNDSFETSDGYIWKYMYSANSATMSKFATTQYMPVVANTSVQGNAVPGSIEVIAVQDGGAGYSNYIVSGHFETADDVRVGGNALRYGLGANGSTLNGYYQRCLLKITGGAASGEYRVITDYQISGAIKIATLDSEFDGVVAVNDTFEVYPFVDVFDTGGSKQTNCIARAIINSTGNTVERIEILDPGSGYKSATAILRPANNVGVTANASLRAIMSPKDGHGANVFSELGASYAGVAVKFIENEGVAPELRTENDFRQVGLIKNPLFANVQITYSSGNTIGNFVPSERVFQYKPIQLTGTVNTYSNSTITGNSTRFEDALTVGDYLLITDGTSNMFGQVSSIANNTQLVMSVNASFTSTTCNVSIANAVSYGIISANSAGTIYIANVDVASITTSTKFVGQTSFATTVADTVKICRGGSTPDVRNTNNFITFSQLTKFGGTINAGTFTEDEYITQDSAVAPYDTPSARLYAAVEDGGTDYLYVTNVLNTWQTGAANGVSTGNTSDAQFTVLNKYEGELVPGSGEVLYIENVSPISRSNTQSETIKLILEF
jgi:hypothetical protein